MNPDAQSGPKSSREPSTASDVSLRRAVFCHPAYSLKTSHFLGLHSLYDRSGCWEASARRNSTPPVPGGRCTHGLAPFHFQTSAEKQCLSLSAHPSLGVGESHGRRGRWNARVQ